MNLYGKNYKLVWEDHFDAIDPGYWEVKNYADAGHEGHKAWRHPNNVRIENSNLVITARIEDKDNPETGFAAGDFTSGMLRAQDTFCYKYGYAEIRAKLPLAGPGRWPGFWMCCPRYDGSGGRCEVDVFEGFGSDAEIACNLHGWWWDPVYKASHHINYLDGRKGYPKKHRLPDGALYSDDYHTIGYEWTPKVAQFLVDGEPYCTVDIDNPVFAAFHQPIYFIISMAFGLKHIAMPVPTDVPCEYYIDYIRLYQNEDGHVYRTVKNAPPEEIGSIYELKTL